MRGEGDGVVRVDLHLYSRASGLATNWWVRGLGAEEVEIRESYTPPEAAYRMAKNARMDFVTLTDHETIEGACTLLRHPDFFAGEEVSARFPESGQYADVLLYGVDARAHRETQARRGDIYSLVDYLREAGVVHVLAHPMYGMPGPLSREDVEKRLVLFGLWEFMNGSRPAAQNRLAQEVRRDIGPFELRQMALRHGLEAPPHRRVAGTGGSDDHGGLYGGATHTVLSAGLRSVEELLGALAAGEVRPAGEGKARPPGSLHGTRDSGGGVARGRGDDGGVVFGSPAAPRRFRSSGSLRPFGTGAGRVAGAPAAPGAVRGVRDAGRAHGALRGEVRGRLAGLWIRLPARGLPRLGRWLYRRAPATRPLRRRTRLLRP